MGSGIPLAAVVAEDRSRPQQGGIFCVWEAEAAWLGENGTWGGRMEVLG